MTFTDESGDSSPGSFLNPEEPHQVVATAWGNLVGTLVTTAAGMQIDWANGTRWEQPRPLDQPPQLAGQGFINGNQGVQITQSGTSLTFTNERGDTSPGYLADATHVVATGWGGLVGTVSATFDGFRINWANGTAWDFLRLAGAWASNLYEKNATQVVQPGNGTALTFTNEYGATSAGYIRDSSHVVATDWGNMVGTLEATADGAVEIDWGQWNTAWTGGLWTKITLIHGGYGYPDDGYPPPTPAPTPTPTPTPAVATGDAGFEQVQVGTAASSIARAARPGPSPAAPASRATAAASPRATRRRREGVQVAFLQRTGSFSQAVAGWAAGTYALTFSAAQRGNSRPRGRTSGSWSTGSSVGTFTPVGHDATRAYTTAAFTVTAGAHTIAFQGLDTAGGDNTAFVDAVAVTQATPSRRRRCRASSRRWWGTASSSTARPARPGPSPAAPASRATAAASPRATRRRRRACRSPSCRGPARSARRSPAGPPAPTR